MYGYLSSFFVSARQDLSARARNWKIQEVAYKRRDYRTVHRDLTLSRRVILKPDPVGMFNFTIGTQSRLPNQIFPRVCLFNGFAIRVDKRESTLKWRGRAIFLVINIGNDGKKDTIFIEDRVY